MSRTLATASGETVSVRRKTGELTAVSRRLSANAGSVEAAALHPRLLRTTLGIVVGCRPWASLWGGKLLRRISAAVAAATPSGGRCATVIGPPRRVTFLPSLAPASTPCARERINRPTYGWATSLAVHHRIHLPLLVNLDTKDGKSSGITEALGMRWECTTFGSGSKAVVKKGGTGTEDGMTNGISGTETEM